MAFSRGCYITLLSVCRKLLAPFLFIQLIITITTVFMVLRVKPTF